jgi:hypothetical protein
VCTSRNTGNAVAGLRCQEVTIMGWSVRVVEGPSTSDAAWTMCANDEEEALEKAREAVAGLRVGAGFAHVYEGDVGESEPRHTIRA